MERLPFRKSHALLIGVCNYDNFENLKTPQKDIQAIGEVLATAIHGYTVTQLIDPTKANIVEFLDSQLDQIQAEDRLLLYFAGHGIALEGDGPGASGYLLPKDADHQNFERAIPMRDLRAFVDKLPCRHGLIVLDCCFAGAFRWDLSTRKLDLMPKRIYQQRFTRFVKDKAWQVITSASYDQKAVDYIGDSKLGERRRQDIIFNTGHSPFAAAFIRGLEGEADIVPNQPDGLITATELYLYLREVLEPVTIDLGDHYRQTPRIFSLPQHDKGEYVFLSPKHPLNLPQRDKSNPYQGLASFEESDSEFFYGRDQVIADLFRHIQQSPHGFTVLSGASGTGKSSLIKAGILPKLRKAGYEILPVMRPGRTPGRAICQSLGIAPASEPAGIRQQLADWASRKKVIVIDQYEELITQCESPEERQRFTEILSLLLGSNQQGTVKIILTVRSDFEPQLKAAPLSAYWQAARYIAPPFSASELRAVILQPANQAVIEFDPPELVDKIINEVIQAPGALPLLSFLLYELYETSGAAPDRPMKEADYDRLGGVIGALRTKADDLFRRCTPAEQITMKKIMVRMVAQDGSEIAGLRIPRRELTYPDAEENQRVAQIIQRLERAALITASGSNNEKYIEPAHDALVRAWGSLWEWIKAFGEDTLAIKSILSRDLKDYLEHGRDRDRLWDDNPRLDQLVEISRQEPHWLTREEYQFIQASAKLKRKKRNRLITTISTVAIVILGLGVAAVIFGLQSSENAALAKQNAQEAINRLAERERLEIDELIRYGTIFMESGDDSLALERFVYVRDTFLSKAVHQQEDSIIQLVDQYIKSCEQNLLNPKQPL